MMLFIGSSAAYNMTMYIAARNGPINIVRHMLKTGADRWADSMMVEAAFGGQLDIVQLLMEYGAHDWNCGMSRAASGGHLHVVKYMADRGANDWNAAMRNAANRGHFNIVRFLVERGADDYSADMLVSSVWGGHADVIKLVVDRGVFDFDWVLSQTEGCAQIAISFIRAAKFTHTRAAAPAIRFLRRTMFAKLGRRIGPMIRPLQKHVREWLYRPPDGPMCVKLLARFEAAVAQPVYVTYNINQVKSNQINIV